MCESGGDLRLMIVEETAWIRRVVVLGVMGKKGPRRQDRFGCISSGVVGSTDHPKDIGDA